MKNAGYLEKSRLPAFLKAGDERIELPPKVWRPLSYHLTNPYVCLTSYRKSLVYNTYSYRICQEKYSYF